jgi:hypothetical protein
MDTEFTIKIADIKDAWIAAVEDGAFPKDAVRKGDINKISTLKGAVDSPDEYDRFAGTTRRDIAKALREGVKPEHESKLRGIALGQEEIHSPQIELVEEDGDLLVDQVLGGEDLYYARWDEVPVHSGARLRILWSTNGNSKAEVMSDYFDWSLSVIDALTAKGLAPSVELRSLTCNTFTGDQWRRKPMSVTYRLAEAGRITDSAAWRAFLAPGAFRTLGFLGYAILAKRTKNTLAKGLGYAEGSDFGVAYDPQDGILDIVCPSIMPDTFPVERMNEELDRVLTLV